MKLSMETFRNSFSQASVAPLVNSHYFHIIPAYFDRAHQSIDIIIFSARYYRGKSNNPVNKFFDALRRAAARGVEIRLLMNANFQNPESIRFNQFIALYFKQQNFQCALSGKSTRIHSKLIIIDSQTCVIGSHNYSQRASRSNFETSVMVQSPSLASHFTDHFNRLWKSRQLVKGAPLCKT